MPLVFFLHLQHIGLLKFFSCYLAEMEHDCDSATTELHVEASNQNSHESCWTTIKNEFAWKRLGFSFNRTDVFTMGQWRLPRFVFVVYRLTVAVYTISITLMSITKFDRSRIPQPWPVWLTNWSFLMLTGYLFWSAVIAVSSLFDRPSVLPSEPLFRRSLPCYIKLNWFLFVVASSAALFVTIVYFTALFPRMRVSYLRENDVHMHIMNSVLVVLELAVSAMPVRILHLVYPLAYVAIYAAFSAIFWAFDHSRVLYPGVLDWNNPARTIVTILVLSVVGFPIIQCLLYAAYRLRLCIYSRIYLSNV